MHRYPMAFHITWGTKGARLHGSSKPHVDRDHNEYGTPFAPTDPHREDESRARMNEDPVSLSPEERAVVERAIRAVANRYEWTIHAKRFGKREWWAEKGSGKYLWERRYFENARDYVSDQRDF